MVQRVFRERFGQIMFLLLTNLASVFSYLYQFINSQHLQNGDFASLGVISNLLIIFSAFIVLPFTASSTEYAHKKDIKHIDELFTAAALVSCLGFVLIFISSFWSDQLYNIPNQGLIITVGLNIFLVGLAVVLRGALIGLYKFLIVGALTLIEPISRVIFAILGVVFNLSLFTINLGSIIGAVLVFLFSYMAVSKYFIKIKFLPKDLVNILTRSLYNVRYAFLYLFALTLFYALDVIIVKRVSDSATADLYSKLSLIGKIIFFGCSPLVTIFFNKFIASTTKLDLWISNALICMVGAVPIVLFIGFPQILEAIFRIHIGNDIVLLFLPGSLFLTLSTLNAYYLVSQKTFAGLIPIIISLVIFIFIFETSGGNIHILSKTYFLINLVVFISLLFIAAVHNIKFRTLKPHKEEVSGIILEPRL